MPPKKSIEETYKKLTQRQHVLERPGMYIGDVKKHNEEGWFFNSENGKMEKNYVEFSPGFMKIFDEVLTNATDHAARDNTVTTIKVDYDVKTGEISVWNNGAGIPVVIHKEHNIYVPELIFGHLLSGSNYDDKQQRIGAGTNGLGSKCSNIFSKMFKVETVDSVNGYKFVQEFTNNMENKKEPVITKSSLKSYTKITFIPDFSRFSMRGLEKDTCMLINKRVYDCIACTNSSVSIYLNGEKLKGKGLTDYVKYFFDEEQNVKAFNETNIQKIGDLEFIWEYIVIPWDKFEHVSFVNGNSTYQGGKHVDHIMYQIVNKLKVLLETKKKLKDVKPATIREKMFLFLRATVVNPQFNSQTKEYLTTQAKDFGCKIEVPDKFIDKLYKSSIVEEIVEFCKIKENLDLAKSTDGKKKTKIFIPKLEDALWAGTAKSDLCTLILTEGDSAKTFALWGRSIVGPDKFGVFPLKGKLLNIRDATVQQLMNNEEINNLKQIIGLKQGKEYTDTSDLRYGKVMCLTDADVDGSHIKGLLINFFHSQWPSLVKMDFIQTLKTPIVKAIKGNKVHEFFTQQDYLKWQESNNVSGYQIKYYKGLGTSTKEDAQNTFRRIENLRVNYYYKDKHCDNSILLAFEKDKNVKVKSDKKKVTKEGSDDSVNSDEIEIEDTNADLKCSDKRKKWLGSYDKDSYIENCENKISYQDFINKDLIHFSIYDNLRSIPSLCDGLKPSQRKILHYMLNKNITKSIKVAQLSGYVSAETSYHHGEASLQQAIIGLAQNFIGSNNVNWLIPDGNFGSRINGGKDSASPRYIFTYLSAITKMVFDNRDTPLLNLLEEDGQVIEPEWYVPVIPSVLVNGCEGIGTGYSTYIPPHDIRDIISNIVRVLDEEQPVQMKPYFKNFSGEVVDLGNGNYITRGKWERLSDTQIKITELPIGTWITPYKEFLESLIENSGQPTKTASKKDTTTSKKDTSKTKKKFVLKDVRNKTSDENTGICFIVEFKDSDVLDKLIEQETIDKELKLVKPFNTNNMYLFDDRCVPTKYKSTTDILLDFCDIRLEYYTKRREYIMAKLKRELSILQSKVRFINEYINNDIVINKKSKESVIALLEERGYKKFCISESDEMTITNGKKSYDYLIRMPLVSLTSDKIDELTKQTNNKKHELDTITNQSPRDLWRIDLDSILTTYN